MHHVNIHNYYLNTESKWNSFICRWHSVPTRHSVSSNISASVKVKTVHKTITRLVFNTALTSRILDQWEIGVGGATECIETEPNWKRSKYYREEKTLFSSRCIRFETKCADKFSPSASSHVAPIISQQKVSLWHVRSWMRNICRLQSVSLLAGDRG